MRNESIDDKQRDVRFIKLDDIAALNPKTSFIDVPDSFEVSFVPMAALSEESGTINTSQIRRLGEVRKGYTSFSDGDILFAKITPCMENGKVAIARGLKNGTGFGSTEYHVIRPTLHVLSEYLWFFLVRKSFRTAAKNKMTGSAGQLRVPLSFFQDVEVPIVAIPEQRAIVAKIEAIFSELDKGAESLEASKARLKVYRQAVLKAAFKGKLTEEWRQKNGSDSDRMEKCRTKEKKLKGRKAEIDEKILVSLPKLPPSWTWESLQNYAADHDNSICAGPFGTIFKARDFRDKGIPIIFLRHVKAGKYITDKPGYMDPVKWKSLFIAYSVFGGELLVTKLGDPPGQCAVYPGDCGPAMVTPDIIKFENEASKLNARYCMHYLNSIISSSINEKRSFGTTRQRITLPLFRSTPLPITSLSEQAQIVSEIESRLSLADKLEATIDEGLAKAEGLRQAVLKKAFEGKLLSEAELEAARREPDWESAEALLERIRAESIKSDKTISKRGRR